MPRTCIFCQGPSSARGHGEHVFPRWINAIFEEIPPIDATQQPEWKRGVIDFVKDERHDQVWSAAEIASLTTKHVCNACNTTWMSKLEGEARPLLTPMIRGQGRKLTQAQQLVAAQWATKTVMVAEPTLDSDEGDHFSDDERRSIMLGTIPGSLLIFAAGIVDQIPPARYSCVRTQFSRGEDPIFVASIHTLQIHTLVLQVIRRDPPPPVYGALKTVATPAVDPVRRTG